MAANIFEGLAGMIAPTRYTGGVDPYPGGPIIVDSYPWLTPAGGGSVSTLIPPSPALLNISLLERICSTVDDRLRVSLDTVNNYDGRAEITIRIFYSDVSSKKILMRRSYVTDASGALIADFDKTVDLLIREVITDMFRVGFPHLMKMVEDHHKLDLENLLEHPLEEEVGDGKSYGL